VDSMRRTVDPWQESLERSLARRGKSNDPSRRGQGLWAAAARQRSARRGAPRRRPGLRRRRLIILVAAASFALGLAVAKLTQQTDGHGAGLALAHANVDGFRTPEGSSYATSAPALGSAAAERGLDTKICRPLDIPASSVAVTGYVNPLAGAHLTPERIDQGVDYAGTGSLTAIGAAKVTRLATAGTGWPGAFIAYKLLGGPDRGCTVYYAEGVRPASGLRVGEVVSAGRPIATLIPGWSTGIEIGWGAGVGDKTYAALKGQWNADEDADSVPTAAGKSFSALISALGGPPGRVEG
jgi:hypothetical protein